MRQLNFLLVSIIFFGFHSCKPKKTPDELKEIFYQNKPKLDLIVITLQKDKKLDSIFSDRTEEQRFIFPEIRQSYPDIYNLLVDAGITEASSHPQVFPKGFKWYFLKTDWPDEYPIYLTFDIFDLIQTVRGFYSKDEVSNETWGLGDHWFMFRWVKDKPY
jgi:hypothetical protein